MKYRNYALMIGKLVAVLVLAVLVTVEFDLVQKIQGSGKVINYSGIVRGATQRLVKLELLGVQDDALILYLDQMLQNLGEGDGFELAPLRDQAYLQALGRLQEMWLEVKAQIDVVRTGGQRQQLLEISEEYFLLASATTEAAERYSDNLSHNIQRVQILIIGCILLLLAELLYQTLQALRLRQKTAELDKIAYWDKQTGLANRLSCELMLDRYSNMQSSGSICCMMLDLNNLKQVNDNLGHSYGDRLIFAFADILRNSLPEGAFVGRFGGDEFIAVLEGKTEQDITQIISRIEENVADYNRQNPDCRLSFSYGYELELQPKPSEIRRQLEKADEKMYIYKRELKSRQAAEAAAKA